MDFAVIFFKCIIFMVYFGKLKSNAMDNCKNISVNAKGTKKFLDGLFQKYGSKNDNFDSIRISKFGKLLATINLGRIIVECEVDDDECLQSNHENEIAKQRTRRDTGDLYNTTNHVSHWQSHMQTCLTAKDILLRHGIQNDSFITKDQFVQICPSLVQQIDSKLCIHFHRKLGNDLVPSRTKVWAYGMLSITIISLLSLAVIAMIPCLKKSFYHKVMSYLVALAVGTLAGDAMLHLIPHAFAEGANAALGSEVSEEDELKQHYSQVWRALFVLLGIYLFFFVEQMMQWKSACKKDEGNGHCDDHDNEETLMREMSSTSPDPDENEEVAFEKNGENEERVVLQTNGKSKSHNHSEGHGHSHGDKNITKDTKISSVAWMVIVGDGFHNFSDGLAVGVAYSASISSGLSTTIAVFCHELPHELGDFAVLINSGMSIKQAIVYNLVSAVLAYIGLIVGILIGGYETGRHFILSITAGLFLYVSLASMLPELSRQVIPRNSRCSSYVCQHLGILSGIAIMLFISLFEHVM